MSSAFEDVGLGDVSKTSQRCYLEEENYYGAILSASGHGEPQSTDQKSFAYSCLIMCYAMV
jgi:hypothetical protein